MPVRKQNDQPTAGQWMTAIIGFDCLRNKAHEDPSGVNRILREYFGSLKETDPGYYTWKYNLDERGKGSELQAITECISYSTDIVKYGPWDKLLPLAEKRRIAEAVKTHCPTNDREAFFMQIGGSGSFDCNSDEIPDGPLLTPDICAGVQTVMTDGTQLVVVPRSRESQVTMEITTWKDMLIGAEHYYVKFKLFYFEPSLKVLRTATRKDRFYTYKKGDIYGTSGWGSDLKPRITRMSQITVRRPLTKGDIKETKARMNPDRYEGYKIGDYIDGFWTLESAKEYGTKVFNQLFDKNLVKLTIDE
jgi:hypothetical protein